MFQVHVVVFPRAERRRLLDGVKYLGPLCVDRKHSA